MKETFFYCPVLNDGEVRKDLASSTPAAAWMRLMKLNPALINYSERKLKEMGYNLKKVRQSDL